jgi:lysyl-tRNA synthetase class 2
MTLSKRLNTLRLRSDILKSVRSFFYNEGFLEVQTPLLTKAPLPEPYIETFKVPLRNNTDFFLIPSPELHMKRLLSEGLEKIFQISPVFRKGERGIKHLPEFTMLEWYRTDADYNDLMDDCEKLLPTLSRAAAKMDAKINYQGHKVDFTPPFSRITVEEAFEKHAGWKPSIGTDSFRFDKDMAHLVEPSLLKGKPVFLKDYPAAFSSLARPIKGNDFLAERVELYVCGMEIANGFSELTDPVAQKKRFREDAIKRKKDSLQEYPEPLDFLSSLENLPPCAGMALGIDRLLMIFADKKKIDDVVGFVEY